MFNDNYSFSAQILIVVTQMGVEESVLAGELKAVLPVIVRSVFRKCAKTPHGLAPATCVREEQSFAGISNLVQ